MPAGNKANKVDANAAKRNPLMGSIVKTLQASLFLRNTIGSLFLITVCPPAAIAFWYCNEHLDGSLVALANFLIDDGYGGILYKLWDIMPSPNQKAVTYLVGYAVFQALLMVLVPGKEYLGPVSPAGNRPRYLANGFQAYLVTLTALYLAVFQFKLFTCTEVVAEFGPMISALNIFSLVYCAFLVFKGHVFPTDEDSGVSGNLVFDYYWGTELYPRILGFDLKMFTNCRFAMAGWGVLILLFAGRQAEVESGGLSDSMFVSVFLQMVYILKFFWWETGYLASIDIMHDRFGFYIGWGCNVWVPAIYTSAAYFLMRHPFHLGTNLTALYLFLGVTAVYINYAADAQRQYVRKMNGNCLVWGQKPKTMIAKYTTETGEEKTSILLMSGWWGISRHFHYLPEIMSAVMWSISGGFGYLMPWFYVVFLIILLFDRAVRDDFRCAQKYGKYWDKYCETVRYFVIPGVY